jgi:hypothetical protein
MHSNINSKMEAIMKARWILLLVAAVLVSGVTAWAHHSFAATYQEDKMVTIEGKIMQFQFRNPHSFVTVEAPDTDGKIYRWGVEWGGAGQLGGQGVNRYTLKQGDIVTISGNPGRNPADHRVRMLTLRRKSDGFGWGQRPGEVVD